MRLDNSIVAKYKGKVGSHPNKTTKGDFLLGFALKHFSDIIIFGITYFVLLFKSILN